MRKCSQCGKKKPLSSFNHNRSQPGGYCYLCRPCDRRRQQEWRNANREKLAASQKRYAEKNRFKRLAVKALERAVRRGDVTKSPCEDCDDPKSEGHHWSYRREHWLDVKWLCRPCHKALHRRERAAS